MTANDENTHGLPDSAVRPASPSTQREGGAGGSEEGGDPRKDIDQLERGAKPAASDKG